MAVMLNYFFLAFHKSTLYSCSFNKQKCLVGQVCQHI